jgi:hypothetical protein
MRGTALAICGEKINRGAIHGEWGSAKAPRFEKFHGTIGLEGASQVERRGGATGVVSFFCFGFFFSGRRASLFPMTHSLPQTAQLIQQGRAVVVLSFEFLGLVAAPQRLLMLSQLS